MKKNHFSKPKKAFVAFLQGVVLCCTSLSLASPPKTPNMNKDEIASLCEKLIYTKVSEFKNGITFQTYNHLNQKTPKTLDQFGYVFEAFQNCIRVGLSATAFEGIDPLLAIAVAEHESDFIDGIIHQENIGVMQANPKYWCKLEKEVSNWDSPSQYLWIPSQKQNNSPNQKCKKARKTLPHQYFDFDECKPKNCDQENCTLVSCDLVRAGMLALDYNKNRNLKKMLYDYNRGYYCNTSKFKEGSEEQQKCIQKGQDYASTILKRYKDLKTLKSEKTPTLLANFIQVVISSVLHETTAVVSSIFVVEVPHDKSINTTISPLFCTHSGSRATSCISTHSPVVNTF